jgi:hypothetical protein
LEQAECTLPYLHGTIDLGTAWPKQAKRADGWVDSDFAADPDTRRSVTGDVCSRKDSPFAWKAKRQSCTSLSSAEAEVVAASVCGPEDTLLRWTLRGVGYEHTVPPLLSGDHASFASPCPTTPSTRRSLSKPAASASTTGCFRLHKVGNTCNVADALRRWRSTARSSLEGTLHSRPSVPPPRTPRMHQRQLPEASSVSARQPLQGERVHLPSLWCHVTRWMGGRIPLQPFQGESGGWEASLSPHRGRALGSEGYGHSAVSHHVTPLSRSAVASHSPSHWTT